MRNGRGSIFKTFDTFSTYPVDLPEPGVWISIRNADSTQALSIVINTHLKGDIVFKVGAMEAFDGNIAPFSSFDVTTPTSDFNIAVGGA